IAREDWLVHRKVFRDPRVSRLGAFLRSSSLDELPQLWNVLCGDMSMVGPRPITTEELVEYGEHVTDYLSVRPGLTGAWQVSGRSEATFAERVKLDVDYVRNLSFAGDLKILFRTVLVVLKRQGAA
ncbi:MAG: sugar transferase, partial [bacterium]